MIEPMKNNKTIDFISEVKDLVTKYGLSSRDGNTLLSLKYNMESNELELDYENEQASYTIDFIEKKYSDEINYTKQKFGQWLERSKRMGAVDVLLIERADASVAQFIERNFLKYGEEHVTISNVSNAETLMRDRQIKGTKSKRFAFLLTLVDPHERIYSFGNCEKLNEYLSIYSKDFDAHDLIDLVQFKAQVQCCRDELAEITGNNNITRIPPELSTPKAISLLKKAQGKGWVDENFKTELPQKKTAILASVIGEELALNPKWKAFETFWEIKDLANKLSQSQITKYYPEFLEEVEKTLL